jgi:GntR family negative regulator for fad regulon and positive regulator of fabA
MTEWLAPARPRAHAESVLLAAILDGTFPPGTTLPGERTLAAQLGVTRPTLREALQRLARDGWLTVAHGKPTLVNNFWEEGGLNVLGKLVEHPAHLPPDFVAQLLEVRLNLAPAYTRAAVARAAPELAVFLAAAAALADPADYARFDWQLHHLLTVRSGNPIYTLILNGFRGFYEDIARRYFAAPAARRLSDQFYADLRAAAQAADADAAEALARAVMHRSITTWSARTADTEKE